MNDRDRNLAAYLLTMLAQDPPAQFAQALSGLLYDARQSARGIKQSSLPSVPGLDSDAGSPPGELASGGGLDAPSELEAENARLRQQVTELQENNTLQVLERRADNVQFQVHEFHTKMGLPILTVPQVPDPKRVKLRLRLFAEEFCEMLTACFPFNRTLEQALIDEINYCTPRVDLVELVDAIVDCNYINAGTALEIGVDLRPHAREVHRSNLAKEPGNLRPDGKILKPPDWKAPEIERILREQGWRGP